MWMKNKGVLVAQYCGDFQCLVCMRIKGVRPPVIDKMVFAGCMPVSYLLCTYRLDYR